jgi:putative Mg2+ transporter-C (MgtC) family protein
MLHDLIGPLHIPVDLGLAALGGSIVGWNRQRKHHPAGLRTMMLVSLGSATFVHAGRGLIQFDPSSSGTAEASRVLQGIVGGIGFLGAGTIIRAGREVKGVTTADAIWVTAGIGAAFGLEQYILGASAVLMTALILLLSPVEDAVFGRENNRPVSSEGSGRRDGDAIV